MGGALVGGEGVGRGGSWLLSHVGADPPAWGPGLWPISGCLLRWGRSLILGTPLPDLLHQGLNIHVLQHSA